MRNDFDQIEDGATVMLYPRDVNPIHHEPVEAFYQDGYFYCKGSDPLDGPDYYFGDVLTYNEGYEIKCTP
ncbi:MAG: hypothetical protein AB7U75_14510 [Hyphomicrobiaceae bacterium]